MLVKSVNGLLFLKAESRKTDYGERYSAIFVDIQNDYTRIQANIEPEIYDNRPPNNSEVHVTFEVSQQNFRTYLNAKSIQLANEKSLQTAK